MYIERALKLYLKDSVLQMTIKHTYLICLQTSRYWIIQNTKWWEVETHRGLLLIQSFHQYTVLFKVFNFFHFSQVCLVSCTYWSLKCCCVHILCEDEYCKIIIFRWTLIFVDFSFLGFAEPQNWWVFSKFRSQHM